MLESTPSSGCHCKLTPSAIEHRNDDITKNLFFFAFQRFKYHRSVEYDEKPPKPIWWPNRYEPGQFTLISMRLIRYSCRHISGPHEPIYVKFGVWGFFIMFYWNMVMKMLKCKNDNFDDVTLRYSIILDQWKISKSILSQSLRGSLQLFNTDGNQLKITSIASIWFGGTLL